MKTTMKKLLAGLLAVCCVPVAGLTAAAVDLPTDAPGTAVLSALDGLQPIHDRGRISNGKGTVYVYRDSLPYPAVMIVAPPCQNRIRFVLRDGLDTDEAEQQVMQIADDCFPGMLQDYHKSTHHAEQFVSGRCTAWIQQDVDAPLAYDLQVYDGNPGLSEANEAKLLLALAQQHLISEFYGFGHTADYTVAEFGEDVLSGYFQRIRKDGTSELLQEVDLNALQAYLDDNHPGCRIEETQVQTNVPMLGDSTTHAMFHILTPETMDFQSKVELACELDEIFHIGVNCAVLMDAHAPAVSGNALERQGDVTLDTELSIIDVIALNKNLMTGEPLCDTAKKNADINGDGTPDEADSLAILKEIIGLTEAFQPA